MAVQEYSQLMRGPPILIHDAGMRGFISLEATVMPAVMTTVDDVDVSSCLIQGNADKFVLLLKHKHVLYQLTCACAARVK